jgi:hypothetical protein
MKSEEEIEKKLALIQSARKDVDGYEVRRGYELALLWVLDSPPP